MREFKTMILWKESTLSMKATGKYIISSHLQGSQKDTRRNSSLVFGFQKGGIFHLNLTEMNIVFLENHPSFIFYKTESRAERLNFKK